MIIRIMKTYSEFFFAIIFILTIFTINLSIEYSKYQELVDEEIYETKVQVLNIYEKDKFYVLKLKANNFQFFTNIDKLDNIRQLDDINIAFITTKINFFTYLKGFYTKLVFYEELEQKQSNYKTLIKISDSQHYNEVIKDLFSALFFAKPVSKELRDICAAYGISHLIALSGFHLGVLSFLIYWFLYYPYSFFHTRYFPYRNKKYDLLLVVLAVLFVYLVFTNMIASLLRAFIMMCLGIYLLRQNIKLFSFINLFFVLLIIIALFPKYIFSLSLWFSLFGVFYIFLFIQYFKDIKSRIFQVLFFNFWIYFAMNPVVHYFFHTTSYEQLYSPILTLLFTIFYPFELVAHLLNYGYILDEYLNIFLSHKFVIYETSTSLLFFIVYLIISFLSIFNKKAFYILNILLTIFLLNSLFSIYLYKLQLNIHLTNN